jgi:hypothetical protein
MAGEDFGDMGSWAAMFSAASPLLKTVGGVATPQPSGPSQANSSLSIDSSGYVVNLGSGSVSSTTRTAGFQLTQWETVGLVALGLMVLLKLSKKK